VQRAPCADPECRSLRELRRAGGTRVEPAPSSSADDWRAGSFPELDESSQQQAMRLDCDKDQQQSLTHVLVHDDLAVGAVTTMNVLQALMKLPSGQRVLARSTEDLVRVDPRHRH
jgi:hypothetical protein